MLVPVLALVLSQAPEAPPARPPEPFTGKIEEPRKIKQTRPEYPMEAYRAGLAGPVILECSVDTEGKVTEAKVERVRAAATKAVEQLEAQ